MKASIWNLKRPFFWSLVLSGLSLFCLQVAVALFHQGLRRPGFFLALAGVVFLLVEVVVFLPRLIRNALRSTGFSILFRVTQPGLIYIGLIFLIAVAAVNTGNNLLYIVLAFMISAIAVSGELSRILLSSLRVALDYQDSIFAGEFTSYRLRLLNAKRWFPAFSVGVEGHLVNKTWLAAAGLADSRPMRSDVAELQKRGVPCMRTVAYFPYLPPRGTDAQSFQVRFPHRGLYRIDAIEVLTAFPFGFFRKGRKIQSSGELVVYPELLDKGDFQACLEHQLETIPVLRKGLGAELFALREYVRGEDVRHIHWKASARAGRYLVKEYATETLQSYVLVLDEGFPGDIESLRGRYERAMSFLATLAMELHQRGRSVRLVPSHSRPPEAGARRDLPSVLEDLAVSYLRPVPESPGDHPLNAPAFEDWLDEESPGSLILCSFRGPAAFLRLAPHLDGYLDMNQI
jgi:uncharacterized protein (DUF58 family)